MEDRSNIRALSLSLSPSISSACKESSLEHSLCVWVRWHYNSFVQQVWSPAKIHGLGEMRLRRRRMMSWCFCFLVVDAVESTKITRTVTNLKEVSRSWAGSARSWWCRVSSLLTDLCVEEHHIGMFDWCTLKLPLQCSVLCLDTVQDLQIIISFLLLW